LLRKQRFGNHHAIRRFVPLIGLGALHINASVIAQGLALEPSLVQAMMRKGENHQPVRARRE
jgi:hypothetical protein